jgi:hypothetical protein
LALTIENIFQRSFVFNEKQKCVIMNYISPNEAYLLFI